MNLKTNLILFLSSLLATTPLAAAPDTQQGYFIDAPVTGLFYRTSSGLSGTTQKGQFSYHPGDVIRFYLGLDEHGYLLTTLSGQEVVTPTLASTQVSRSVNMTRLLLSLDATPQNREEITLLSQALTDRHFIQQLKQLDLSFLDDHLAALNLPLVSTQQAVEHLNQSQHYIEQNFVSDEVIYRPKGVMYETSLVPKKDWQGKICAYNLDRAAHPNYFAPIGKTRFSVGAETLTEYPAIGDHFNGCQLRPEQGLTEAVEHPLGQFAHEAGLIGCARHGCTRNDLNGFYVEDFDDEGDWKYRTIAMNFDPVTELFMEKSQGLGHKARVSHNNRSEMMWFTYPNGKGDHIPLQGIWLRTRYLTSGIQHQCLRITASQVLLGPESVSECPSGPQDYTRDVTAQYRDMWWLQKPGNSVNLGDLNITVTWFEPERGPQFTSWEYLPAGHDWDQGILYRYQQRKQRSVDGRESMQTLNVDEFTKQHKDS